MAVDQTSRVPLTPDRAAVAPDATTTGRLRSHIDGAYRVLTERPLSLYAAAFMRIGYGLLYAVVLVREFPHRHQIWGPESPWTPALARETFDQTGWFSLLTLSDSRQYFEFCYVVALLTAVLFTLGWRTRAVSVLFAIVVASFYGRNVLIGDGGDNLALLMAVYLVFTACGRRWSLDARRARRRAPVASRPAGAQPSGRWAAAGIARRFTATVLHNCAMLVIMAQMCILYGAAGLYKVQGDLWANGTALHYVLHSDLFRPWPALSDFVDDHQLMVGVASYLSVLVQVAFPFTLFSKVKYVVLAILVGMHLGIAVLLGLPVFSGVMILGDAVFLPDRFFRSVPRLWRALRARRRGPGTPALTTP
ncbi:HTTM domain-containing protein [Actinoplanes sp. NEAU-A12]|uniref:HTTM domain-containing protein n=1 Tax=Actinoplanes sandaracinus TaxID=3045177 RepID=A0ABT6WBD5_9ACTN|nr:HTTM domain-containing protein [Actinoplanes sandaracinus]MDI6097022.1 HTTM domain-containing protein [Actinoplanes sandaracinus]